MARAGCGRAVDRLIQHRAARAAIVAAVLLALVVPSGASASAEALRPSVANAVTTAAQDVVAAARAHIGAPYRFGGTGPSFDCSGLVFRVFKETGHLSAVGGKRRTAAGFLDWFRARGLVSRTHGRRGDLVVYNGGTHVGIYVGHGRVISATVRGVRAHGLHGMTIPFTAFLHTHLGVSQVAPG